MIILPFQAYAEATLPPAISDEKSATYESIFKAITEKSQNVSSIEQAYGLVAITLQMMPPDERQDMVMKLARDVQGTPKQKRLQGLEACARVWHSFKPEQKTRMIAHMTRTLEVMTPVEQKIIGVQMNKLLKDLPDIPVEDRNSLTPVMNTIISKALAP